MIFVDTLGISLAMQLTFEDEPMTRRPRKTTASTRLTLEMDKRISELMELQDDDRSGVLRRVLKLGLAAYDLKTDFLLGEFVERWRALNDTERRLLISFADSMLTTPQGIIEHPKEAQVKIPIVKNPK